MARMTLSIELRGQTVEIDLYALPPEYAVGLPGWGFEDELILDAGGKRLDWNLTDEEIDAVNTAVAHRAGVADPRNASANRDSVQPPEEECVACEGEPKAGHDPCVICGRATIPPLTLPT